MVRFYLKNTVLSPATLVGMLGLWLGMLAGTDFMEDLLYCYEYTIGLGVAGFFLPVATVLPICLLERQMNAGIRGLCLARSSRRSFSFGAVLGAVVSGMAVALGAFVLFTVFCALYNPHSYFGDGMAYNGQSVFSQVPLYAALYEHPVLHYLTMGGVFTLNGSLWPAISLACLSFTSNQYLALAAPFVLRVVTGYFAQSFQLFFLDPGQLLLKVGIMSFTFGGGIPYILIYCATVILICGILWSMSVTRRLRHG